MTITIAVDAMGGDHGCRVTIPAVLEFLERNPDVHAILVGLPDVIDAELKRRHATDHARLTVEPATEVVGMDESPQSALKNKKHSSMRIAINLVKEGRAQACVSAGNTGALMATSRFVLKMLPGIERPAIAKLLPNPTGSSVVLDLGANVDCEPLHLLQFGVMGAMLATAMLHRENPSVGLLNVGTEEIKGTPVIKEAAELLRASGLNFHGFVEGNDIYRGTTDVVVCDGFTGNVALKTSEGIAKMMGEMLREAFAANPLAKLMGLCAYPVLRAFKRRLDPRRYNGASMLGLKGTVVKSHGSADELAFRYAMEQALSEVTHRVIERISEKMAESRPHPADTAPSQEAV